MQYHFVQLYLVLNSRTHKHAPYQHTDLHVRTQPVNMHNLLQQGGICPPPPPPTHCPPPSTHTPHTTHQPHLDGCVRVPVIDPGPHSPQHQAQATWEAARVVLTQAELNGVDGCLNGPLTEPCHGQLCKLVQDQLLNCIDVSGVNTLERTKRLGSRVWGPRVGFSGDDLFRVNSNTTSISGLENTHVAQVGCDKAWTWQVTMT